MDAEERRREEMRAVEEAGGGESEGFELAEQELIEHATHGDMHAAEHIFADVSRVDEELDTTDGEADHELTGDDD